MGVAANALAAHPVVIRRIADETVLCMAGVLPMGWAASIARAPRAGT
jgi:hypothetical protein